MSSAHDPSNWSAETLDRLYKDIQAAPSIDLSYPTDHPSHGPHTHTPIEPPEQDHARHREQRLRHNRAWIHSRDNLNRAPRTIRPALQPIPLTAGNVAFIVCCCIAAGYFLRIVMEGLWTP